MSEQFRKVYCVDYPQTRGLQGLEQAAAITDALLVQADVGYQRKIEPSEIPNLLN